MLSKQQFFLIASLFFVTVIGGVALLMDHLQRQAFEGDLIASVPAGNLRVQYASVHYGMLYVFSSLTAGLIGVSYFLFNKVHKRTCELIGSEKKLRASEARLVAMLGSIQDPIITINSRGIIQTASKSVEAVFGWKPKELIGQNVNVLMAEPYRSEHDTYLAQYQRTGISSVLGKSRELPTQRRDGTVFPSVVTLWKVDLPEQSEQLFMGTIRDITARKRSEAKVESLNRQLVDAARQAGKAEIATSVLHNVGNVLNSVNVSARLFEEKVRALGVPHFNRAIDVMEQHLDDLGAYVTQDERGKHLPKLLIDVSRHMAADEGGIFEEVRSLVANVDHIKTIVATQQSYASGVSAIIEEVAFADLLEDAIRISTASMQRHSVQVVRQFDEIAPALADKQKILQIIVNLLHNAKHACDESGNEEKQVTVSLRCPSEDRVAIEVRDNGVGITLENRTRIFAHGFTTRKEGHGFGLHSAALVAEELNGSLTAFSEGPGTGAAFTLNLPYKNMEFSVCAT